MIDTRNIAIEEYDYDLPDQRIAKYPLNERDRSKLLIYDGEQITNNSFFNIASYLPESSLLVSNNTKVIRARIELFKETGARIEVFCLEPHYPADYAVNFASNQSCQWLCIVGNLKKWKQGKLMRNLQLKNHAVNLSVERLSTMGEAHLIEFSWDNENVTFSEILEFTGNIPIPPYLNRDSEESDNERYQTIYSKHKGSVAAPTAGLHFTESVFKSLENKDISRHEITLHVGAGTFKPVKASTIGEHEMHYEQFVITPDTIPAIIDNIGKITAVGTTTVRTLESLYWLGVKCVVNDGKLDDWVIHQWDAYDIKHEINTKEALQALQKYFLSLNEDYINAATGIMIAPGYKLRVVDVLVTNFHQPRSTLLLLIAAIVGKKWKNIYNYALENDFRFLSYGDSCLLKTKKGAL